MSSQSIPPEPSRATVAILQQAHNRVQNTMAANYLWSRLSPEDQAKLGNNLKVAYRDGGTIGMWMRLHDVDEAIALAQVAFQCNLLNVPDFNFVMHEIFSSGSPDKASACAVSETTVPAILSAPNEKPIWDSQRRQLSFRGQIIRRFRGKNIATNVSLIVTAFHEEQWEGHIDDPLPGGRDSQRLRETVANLNEGLSLIRFLCDGSGQGVCWEPI